MITPLLRGPLWSVIAATAAMSFSSSVMALAMTDTSGFISVQFLGVRNVSNPGGNTDGVIMTAEGQIVAAEAIVDSFESPPSGTATITTSAPPETPTPLLIGETIELNLAANVTADGRETTASSFATLNSFIGVENTSANVYIIDLVLRYSAETSASITGPDFEQAFGAIELSAENTNSILVDLEAISDAILGPESDSIGPAQTLFNITLFPGDQDTITLSLSGSSNAASVPVPGTAWLLLSALGLFIVRRTVITQQ